MKKYNSLAAFIMLAAWFQGFACSVSAETNIVFGMYDTGSTCKCGFKIFYEVKGTNIYSRCPMHDTDEGPGGSRRLVYTLRQENDQWFAYVPTGKSALPQTNTIVFVQKDRDTLIRIIQGKSTNLYVRESTQAKK